MSNVKHISYYTNVTQQWSKPLGAKPTEAQLSLAHVFGRPGKQSLAVAMALRDGGVTGSQVKLASSLFDGKATPQLNHMRDLIKARMFNREAVPGAYAITLGPKGQQFVDLHGAKAVEKLADKAAGDKPVKAGKKAKVSKPRKAKAETVTITETAPEAVVVPVSGEAPAKHATA
jgi:hypothetical protein